VQSRFEGAVFAIDVRHPWDYRTGLPPRRSEALRLEGGTAWRILMNGRQERL
jgi:hypothetical protein